MTTVAILAGATSLLLGRILTLSTLGAGGGLLDKGATIGASNVGSLGATRVVVDDLILNDLTLLGERELGVVNSGAVDEDTVILGGLSINGDDESVTTLDLVELNLTLEALW